MSARRIVMGTMLVIALLAISVLWWRHGTSVFLSSLGSMICAAPAAQGLMPPA